MNRNALKAHELAVAKFEELLEKRNSKKIMRYPEVFSIFSWYHIEKEEVRRVLDELQASGKIKIIPFHGIKFMGK